MARDFLGLNMAKMKGHKDTYRVKHGRLRVIFRMNPHEIFVLEVGLRSEKTYRGF
jgi:mRNA-degrading endonuclease RelE of RelBE toxin-antitoxin system